MFILTGQGVSTQHSVTQFWFMNLNTQTTNMTFLGSLVILPPGAQSSGTFCGIRMEIGPGFTFQCIIVF